MTWGDAVLWGSIGLCLVLLVWQFALHACWWVAEKDDDDER